MVNKAVKTKNDLYRLSFYKNYLLLTDNCRLEILLTIHRQEGWF